MSDTFWGSQAGSILDGAQMGLSVAGMTPVLGNAADLLNAGISFARGNVGDGLLNLGCAVPGMGQVLAGSVIFGKVARGARNPLIRKAIEKGKRMHKQYSEIWSKRGYITDKSILGTRLRPDAINIEKGVIRELKPRNSSARRKGLQQLQNYKEAAEKAYEKAFRTIIEFYD